MYTFNQRKGNTMRTHIFTKLICAACLVTIFTGCDDCGGGKKKFGCRADDTCPGVWIKNKGNGCAPRTYAFLKSNMQEAAAAATDKYQEEYPGSNPNVNCWDCSRTDLDPAAKKACNK